MEQQSTSYKGGFSRGTAARFNIRWKGGGRSDIILSSLLKLVITLIIALAFSRSWCFEDPGVMVASR